MTTLRFPLGQNIYHPEQIITLPFRPFTNILIAAQPRYGKGGVAKPLVVRLSKHRPVLIFDFRGEWSRHVTHPNYQSPSPDYLAPHTIYKDFTFRLRDFTNLQDWVSMGFDEQESILLSSLFKDTLHFHRGNPAKFVQAFADLPTRERDDEINNYNARYGVNLKFAFNWSTKHSIGYRLPIVMRWFHQGKDDHRKVIDFGREWLQQQHILIDFTSNYGDTDEYSTYRHRTFCGKILQQLRPYYRRIHGVIVTEEADMLFPNTKGRRRPSSNLELLHYVSKAPKDGMGLILIMQNPSQTDQELFRRGQWAVIKGMISDDVETHSLLYDPEGNYRQFIFMDVNRKKYKFIPDEPICEYESNITKVTP